MGQNKAARNPSALPKGDFAELRKTGSGRVLHVIDPQTLQLQDGRLIRLTGLDFPDLSLPQQEQDAGDFALTAQQVLRDMLLNQEVNIYQTKDSAIGRTNRMGHHLAHLERAQDGAWAQGTLLALGLTRVRTSQHNPDMADQMYLLERAARAQKNGLWEHAGFRVLSPEEATAMPDGFYVVEGAIISAALNNNRVYLNFGKNWRDDFTVSIASADRRRFSRAGLDPLSWNGQRVRVRGWQRQYNGGYIEINHPQAIEILAAQDSAPSSGAPSSTVQGHAPSALPSALPLALPDALENLMVEPQRKDQE